MWDLGSNLTSCTLLMLIKLTKIIIVISHILTFQPLFLVFLLCFIISVFEVVSRVFIHFIFSIAFTASRCGVRFVWCRFFNCIFRSVTFFSYWFWFASLCSLVLLGFIWHAQAPRLSQLSFVTWCVSLSPPLWMLGSTSLVASLCKRLVVL